MAITNGDRFAEAAAIMAQATQSLAESARLSVQTQQSLDQTTQRLEADHRFALRLQTFALVLIGLTLLGMGFLVWQHLAHSQEHAAMLRALNETLQRLPSR